VPAFRSAGIAPGELKFVDVDVDTVFMRNR